MLLYCFLRLLCGSYCAWLQVGQRAFYIYEDSKGMFGYSFIKYVVRTQSVHDSSTCTSNIMEQVGYENHQHAYYSHIGTDFYSLFTGIKDRISLIILTNDEFVLLSVHTSVA